MKFTIAEGNCCREAKVFDISISGFFVKLRLGIFFALGPGINRHYQLLYIQRTLSALRHAYAVAVAVALQVKTCLHVQ